MRLAVSLLCLLLAVPIVDAALPPSPFESHPSAVAYVGGLTLPGNDYPGAGCYGTLQGEGITFLGACFMALPSASTFTIQVKDAVATAVPFRWVVEIPSGGAAGAPHVCASGTAAGETTQPVPSNCSGAYVTVELGTGATVGVITVS